MNSRKDISEELREMNSSLPASNSQTGYTVPEGYFEELASTILRRISPDRQGAAEETAAISPLIAGIKKQMPYSLPDNYFGQAAEDLAAIAPEEKESLVLSFIDKTMPYDVPLGYFAGLPDRILESVSRPAKIVPFRRRKWAGLAVAATIAGLMLTGYFYFSNGSRISVSNPEWVAKNVKNVSSQEMEEFVRTTDISEAVPEAPSGKSGKADIRKLLLDVSDSELEAFLTQVPVEDEDLLGIN